MNTIRSNFTATRLPDGRVLVVGGGGLNSAEVYNPANGSWSWTGSMATARWKHTATLLDDGRVLVAGGYNDVYFSSAEVYSPTTGLWSTTGSMNDAREQHTATLLDDGRVLVVGGKYSIDNLYHKSAEVYDPATGSWSRAGYMTVDRWEHTATLLADGRVLVVGGHNNTGLLKSAEVYDPATGSWSTIADMNIARWKHTATLLDDGRVLVVGGYNGAYLKSAEVYDPATGSWSTIDSMNDAREKHTATRLADGRVLVVGGKFGASDFHTSAEVYDPATGLWSLTGSMATARWIHTATLLDDGRVLVVGGNNNTGYLNSAEVYNFGISRDLRTTIGKVYDRHPVHGKLVGDQLMVAYSESDSSSSRRLYGIRVYDIGPSPSPPTWSLRELDDEHDVESGGGDYVNLASGDMNADGLEEIVYARSGAVHVIDYDRQSGAPQEISFAPANADRVNDSKIILAVGDVDLDGKAEIAYWTQDNRVAILDLVDENTLHLSGSITPTVQDGELLIGDLDDDTFRAELVGCTSFSEVSVIAVLNGAPRVYASDLPVQDTDVRYAKTATGGSSSSWGTTTNLGGFASVGFEVELSVPFIGTKLGEVRGSVTQDFMASQGQTRAVEESFTQSSGYNADGQTLGIVVYNETDYKCYYYDL